MIIVNLVLSAIFRQNLPVFVLEPYFAIIYWGKNNRPYFDRPFLEIEECAVRVRACVCVC